MRQSPFGFKSILLLQFSLLTLVGCGTVKYASDVGPPPPSLTTLSVSPYTALKESIDSLLHDSLFPPSHVGIKIFSLDKRELLYSLNERMLFNPASNQKLFTSATALRLFGPRYVFSTKVFVDTGSHTLFLKGYGDPLLSTGDMDSMARQLASQLQSSSPWNLSIDESYFDDLYWGAGWTWDEEPAAYGMFISPLILDNNVVTVVVQPGAQVGDSVIITLEPQVTFVEVENRATTVLDSAAGSLEITRKWRERSNTIQVEGQMRVGSRQRRERLSVWQPSLFAGRVFAERLGTLGVHVQSVQMDTVPAGAPKVLEYTHTLDTVITFLNKESDNLSAESILKTLGVFKTQTRGSAEHGIHLMYDTLAAWGVDTNRISIADGSGLSRYNLTSAATIITLLQKMYENQDSFGPFFHSLPIAGVDGTIGSRMKGTPAAGNLRAKTGTLSAVSALSGYVRSADGEMLAFSILMQNFPGSSRRYRGVQDAIGVLLSGFSREGL